MTVAALVLLAVLAGGALPFQGAQSADLARSRAVLLVVPAALLVAVAGALAWRAAPVTGWPAVLAAALAVAAATSAGSPVATALLRLAQREDAPPGAPSPAQEGSLRGGEWIGLLERLAIGASVVAGWPAGLAVVLAVKGLGRYPELRAAADAAASGAAPAALPAQPPPGAQGPAPAAATSSASPAASSAAAERFIIGTFGSVLWAVACAGVGWALLH